MFDDDDDDDDDGGGDDQPKTESTAHPRLEVGIACDGIGDFRATKCD